MPFEIVWEPRGVYKRFTGNVSFQEYMRSQEIVLGDVRTDDLKYVINDLTAAEGYSASADDAEYSAAFNEGVSRTNPRLQVAYVTTDVRAIALIKIGAVFSSLVVKRFPTLEEARAWASKLVAASDK
jgi:hypothetical protein